MHCAIGVIRIINKRSASYSLDNKDFELSPDGFDQEDAELMQTIASQIAIAIQNSRLLEKFMEAQRLYQNVIMSSPDPIIAIDKKGKIEIFNRACEYLWGLSYEEARGKSILDFYASPIQARRIGRLLLESQSNSLEDFETTIKDKSGAIIPVSLSASILRNGKGELIGSLGIFKDVRRLKVLEEKMLQSEKLATLGKLAQTVGHDIKHNIATALNYVQTLSFRCDPVEDAQLLDIYEDITSSLWEAVENLQNMIVATKPKAAQKSVVDIKDVFDEFEVRLARQANSRGIEFSVHYPQRDEELLLDVSQIRQALTNLFDNSVSAIEEKKSSGASIGKGQIEAVIWFSDSIFHLSWKDNGRGIPPDNVANIFTPFFTTRDSGNGLGLFIVKQIIENHGGEISVQSEEGEGSSFLISIPTLQSSVNSA